MFKIHAERTIEIAHKLTDHKGKCKNLHGHSVKVTVDVYSNKLDDMGMVIDFGVIKEIIDKYDHTYLNDSISNYGLDIKCNPTAERLARVIATEIDNYAVYEKVVVRVYETTTQYAEFTLEGVLVWA